MSDKIVVQNTKISLKKHNKDDFISLTDIAKAKNPDKPKDVLKNWIKSTNAVGLSSSAGRYGGTYAHKNGNIRDYSSVEELTVLSNMESNNAMIIQESVPQNKKVK